MSTFKKALTHLKSSQIDEKIKNLNASFKKTGILIEAPTNSTSGLYQQGDTLTIPPVLDGWHPSYGKRSHMYNSLDKISAMSMPLTGDKEIDSKVQKAKRLKPVKAVLPDS